MMPSSMLNTFNPENSEKPDFIAGLFRRGHISLLAAEPGLGKSILIQKLICDLSVGGAVFDGFCVSEPMTIMLFCGEAGLTIMNERLSNTGWPFDQKRIKVLDSREAWRAGYIPTLENDERDMFSSLTEEAKPDLIIVDSLGSFVSDESDRGAMKKVFDFLLALGDRHKCAILLVHHLRKRKNGKRHLPLAQSEVIGSSIIARHASLLICMEKIQNTMTNSGEPHEILVRGLKSWDKPFPQFSFRIESDDGERPGLRFNLNPSVSVGKKAVVWSAILNNFGDGRYFARGHIENLCRRVSSAYIKKLLSEWTGRGRLEKRGLNRDTMYRLVVSFPDE